MASEAIRKLRDLPECNAAIEAALATWFASVEHELNEAQLVRAAKCIVFTAGPRHQKPAVDYLFRIAKQLPMNPGEDLAERLNSEDDELDDVLRELVLNDDLAIQLADRLKVGTSAERYFVVSILMNRNVVNQQDAPEQAKAKAWFRSHEKLFIPAFEAASLDESEGIRMFALIGLTGLDPQNPQLLSRLADAIESDLSAEIRGMAVRLLSSKEIAPAIKSQNIDLIPLLIKTLESEPDVEVQHAALAALMQIESASELVHTTLLQLARSKDHDQVQYALTMMSRRRDTSHRPQSIDELIELLSDPEWGTDVQVTQHTP